MTQIQTNLNLLAGDGSRQFAFPDLYYQPHLFPSFSSPVIPNLFAPLQNFAPQPQFPNKRLSRNFLDCSDLGNPIKKKVKGTQPDSYPLPSINSNLSLLSLFAPFSSNSSAISDLSNFQFTNSSLVIPKLTEKPKAKSSNKKETVIASKPKLPKADLLPISSSVQSMSSSLQIMFEEPLIPKFSPSESEETDTNQLQQALQVLQNKISVSSLQTTKVPSFENEGSQVSGIDSMKTQDLQNLSMLSALIKDSKEFVEMSNLMALASGSNISYPFLEDLEKENLSQKKINANKSNFNERKMIKLSKKCDNKEFILNLNEHLKSNDLVPSISVSKIDEEQIQIVSKTSKIEVNETIQEITVDKSAQNNEVVSIKTSIVHSEVINNDTEITKVNIKTKRGPFISPWSIASARRKNRWQLTQGQPFQRPQGCQKATLQSKRAVKKPQEIDVKETPVGSDHQVPIPNLQSKRCKTMEGKRHPKLKWSPTMLTKLRFEYYLKTLAEMLQCDVNQEKAISLLRENNNDPRKVYKMIEGREKEFLREFIIRPRRKP